MRPGWLKRSLREDLDAVIAFISGGAGLVLAATSVFGLTDVKVLLAVTQITLGSLSVGVVRDRLSDRAKHESLDQTAKVVRGLSLTVQTLSKTSVYENQDIPYAQLLDYIDRHGVKEAVFLQYSGQACASVLEAVLRTKGAQVTMYLQDEKTAAGLRSDFQAARIIGSIHNLSLWRRKYDGVSDLHVYKCAMPMSVRAIMFDERLLCMGWYTYERDEDYDVEHFPDDTVVVFGHNTATVVAQNGTAEFDALRATLMALVDNYKIASQQVSL